MPLHFADMFLFLLLCVAHGYGTADISPEKCEDRYGADLTVNFALQQLASQTSTSNGGGASRSVDGNKNAYFTNGSCSETVFGQDVSWQVDLQTMIYVTSVTITARADDYWNQPDYFKVLLSKDNGANWKSCTEGYPPDKGETVTMACHLPMQAAKVKIQVPGTKSRLSLCEVEVHGRPLDFHDHEVNFALRRPTRQSSSGAFISKGAVDGDRVKTDIYDGSCSLTLSETMAWWQVDLERTVGVYAVTITSRDDKVHRLNDFEIRVGGSDSVELDDNMNCAGRLSLPGDETRSFFCFRSIRGRYVTVRSRMIERLQLCELSVQGMDEKVSEPLGL